MQLASFNASIDLLIFEPLTRKGMAMGTTAGEHVALLIRAHLVIDDGCIKSLSWGFASYELFIESLCEKCGDIIPYFG